MSSPNHQEIDLTFVTDEDLLGELARRSTAILIARITKNGKCGADEEYIDLRRFGPQITVIGLATLAHSRLIREVVESNS